MIQSCRATGCAGVIIKFVMPLGSCGWAATYASRKAAHAVTSSARYSIVEVDKEFQRGNAKGTGKEQTRNRSLQRYTQQIEHMELVDRGTTVDL
jgi:hypothetical protein